MAGRKSSSLPACLVSAPLCQLGKWWPSSPASGTFPGRKGEKLPCTCLRVAASGPSLQKGAGLLVSADKGAAPLTVLADVAAAGDRRDRLSRTCLAGEPSWAALGSHSSATPDPEDPDSYPPASKNLLAAAQTGPPLLLELCLELPGSPGSRLPSWLRGQASHPAEKFCQCSNGFTTDMRTKTSRPWGWRPSCFRGGQVIPGLVSQMPDQQQLTRTVSLIGLCATWLALEDKSLALLLYPASSK